MKFTSRTDIAFSFIVLGISIFVLVLIGMQILKGQLGAEDFFSLLLTIGVVGVLLWLYFNTKYEVSHINGFLYKSGLFHRKISIDRITEVKQGKNLWMGFRPATARKGLIF